MATRVSQGSIYRYRLKSGSFWGWRIDAPGDGRRQPNRRFSDDGQRFRTKAEARDSLEEYRKKLRDGKVPRPDDGTVAGFCAGWIAALPVEGLEGSTVLHYSQCMKRLLPFIGEAKIQELAAQDLD